MTLPRRASADGPTTAGSSADDVPDADPIEVARSICLSQLAMGPRTRGQLATVLRRRGVVDDAAATVLDRFEEVALVDDAAFSENYVARRHASSGLSRRALGHELRGKGVSDSVVTEALETLSADDELASAQGLVAKRLASTRRFDVETRTRRLVGMLARKGYPSGLAMRVVREAIAAESQLDALERAFLDGLDSDLSDAARIGE